METTKLPRSKFPALITYIFAVLILIAGLILPLETKTLSGGIDFTNMPVMQITGALAALKILQGALPFGNALSPAYSFSQIVAGVEIDFGAAVLLAYALVTVLALILLIPACIAARRSDKARKIIVTAEIIALAVLLLGVIFELAKHTDNWNLSILIPFGGVLLMLIIQSIVYFKGSGVIKTVLVLLSVIAALFIAFDIAISLPFLASPFATLAAKMSGARPFATAVGLFSIGETVITGNWLMSTVLVYPQGLVIDGNISIAIANYVAIALVVLVILNLFLDIAGLGKRTTVGMLNGNLVRYIAEFGLLITLAVMVFSVMGSFGLLLYFVLFIAIVQLIIEIIRRARFKYVKPAKKPARAKKVIDADEQEEEPVAEPEEKRPSRAPAERMPAYDPYPYPASSTIDEPIPKPITIPDPVYVSEHEEPAVYKVSPIYSGPTDDFIDKLNNEEKIEFAQVFLEKRVGNVSGVPNYRVGGDNSKFFSYAFIYYARVRESVSDGLMAKMYQEVNTAS